MFLKDCRSMLKKETSIENLKWCKNEIHTALTQLEEFIGRMILDGRKEDRDLLELTARDFSYSLARVYIGEK